MPIHFGVTVREGKRSLKLARENYAIVNNKNSLSPFSSITYADEEGKYYTNEWCAKHLDDCMKNYDLNMEYFSLLNREEFNNAIATLYAITLPIFICRSTNTAYPAPKALHRVCLYPVSTFFSLFLLPHLKLSQAFFAFKEGLYGFHSLRKFVLLRIPLLQAFKLFTLSSPAQRPLSAATAR